MAKMLIDPIYTLKNLSGCGTYYWLKESAFDFLDRDENNYVYCAIPDRKSVFNVDERVKHPRWKNIPTRFAKDRYMNIFLPHDSVRENFARWRRYGDWDFVFTTRSNGYFWRMLNGRWNSVRRALILGEPFPLMTFKSTVSYGNKNMLNMRSLSSYFAFDKVYIHTEYEKREIMKSARRLMSPTVVNELDEKIDVKFNEDDELDRDYPRSDRAAEVFKEEPLKVFYPQRIDETERRFSDVHDMLQYLFTMLNKWGDVEVHIFTNSPNNIPMGDTSFINLGRYPRDEFWEMLKTSHIFVSCSKEEGLPFAVVEAILFGNIGVVKREDWSVDLFGDDYFGLFDNKKEAVSKIKWIKENREKAWSMFREWYEEVFIPMLEDRGDHLDCQWDFMENWLDRNANNVNLGGGFEEAAQIIEESDKKIVNLSDIEVDDVRLPTVGDVAYNNGLYFRTPAYYTMRTMLINHFSWEDTVEPWTLKRAK